MVKMRVRGPNGEKGSFVMGISEEKAKLLSDIFNSYMFRRDFTDEKYEGSPFRDTPIAKMESKLHEYKCLDRMGRDVVLKMGHSIVVESEPYLC